MHGIANKKKKQGRVTALNIVYYITSHGFGHGIRSCAICNRLSPDTGIFFRTALPRSFFEEEVKRPFEYAPATFDCGCVQTDCVTEDRGKTVSTYLEIARSNAALLSSEILWCRRNRIDGIVSDIVPFAFEVAGAAGIPSIAATNFTWYDIYKEYCREFPRFAPEVEKIKAQYSSADLLLAMSPALPMDYFGKRERIAPVGRDGVPSGEKLRETFGIAPGKRLGLIYAGKFGMDSLPWKRMERFNTWEFLGLYPLPGAPANYHTITKNAFRYQDIVASVDCVIGKVGYGVYAECVINGVWLIHLPRAGFAEYPALEAAIVSWGGGYRLSHEEFHDVAWDAALCRVLSANRPRPRPSDGALSCARLIESTIKNRR